MKKKKSTFFTIGGLSRNGCRGRGASLSELSIVVVARKRFLARCGCLPFADFAFAEVIRRLDGIVLEGRVSASYEKKSVVYREII
jgi:hypothetical protein